MKIEYKFVDGTITEIKVNGSLGEFEYSIIFWEESITYN